MSSDYYGSLAGEIADEPCDHDHDEECYDGAGNCVCVHGHCPWCGGCQCPGYCDDYQTYNLRPAETGGEQAAQEPAPGGGRMTG